MARNMTQGSITGHLLVYAVPLVFGNLFQQLYHTVDSVVVGQFNGKEALAAIGAAGPIMNILIFLIVGLSMGASIIMAEYFGAGDFPALKKEMATSIVSGLILTVIITVLAVAGSGLFIRLTQTPEEIAPLASDYLRIVTAGLIFTFFYNILSAGLRAIGDSKAPLYVLIITTVVNVVLDILLVGTFHMSVYGAAVATVIAQSVSSLLLFAYIAVRAKKRFETPYGPEFHILSLGCYSFANLSLLPPALKRLSEQYPDLHPQLQAVPFQHLYQMLEEDEVDAVIGFREPESKRISAHYRELGRARVVCVCAPDHPLSGCSSVKIEDLAEEKLVLIDPARTQADAARLQGQLMDGRSPSSVYFCESAEAASILVRAGFGISILPDLFLPPESLLARIPVDGVTPISFGIYYKSMQDNPPLQSLIQILQKGLSTVDGDGGV